MNCWNRKKHPRHWARTNQYHPIEFMDVEVSLQRAYFRYGPMGDGVQCIFCPNWNSSPPQKTIGGRVRTLGGPSLRQYVLI